MFLQRCFYIFIKWASTLSPFLETLPTPFLFLFREKRMPCGVQPPPIFPLHLLFEKRPVVFIKVTRRFDENNPSFLCKRPVVFFVPRNTFFIKKLTSIIFQGHTTYSQNESSQGDFPLFFKEIIPQNLVNRQKYYKFATQSLQNNLLKVPFCAQFGSLRR